MKLRTKLLVGYAGFVLALGVIGTWSARTLSQMSAVSGRIIAENYDSVVAAQDMKESLERQDSAALFDLLEQHDRARRQHAEHRRRFNAVEYLGKKKRGSDRVVLCPHSERITQALKIMKTAIEALDAKPQQAVRALYAQADEIREAAAALGNHSMGIAAQTLRSYLDTATRGGKFDRAQFKRDMSGMFDTSPPALEAG